MKKYKLKFECVRDGKVFGLGGSECHGLLFSILHDSCPVYSQELHQASINPFSIGPLRGAGKRRNGCHYLQSGAVYSFTVSSLSEGMDKEIAGIFNACHPAHQFRLGTADCRWLCIEIGAEENYESLLEKEALPKFTLAFTSPTCFRSQGLSLLFPAPELVFDNLAERWNAFAPKSHRIGLDLLPFISRYNLKTSMIQFAKYRMTGFSGSAEYCFLKNVSVDNMKVISALARFATYTGVGYKTGMGMGESNIL